MLPTSFPQTFICAMPSLQPYAIDKDLFGTYKIHEKFVRGERISARRANLYFAFPYLTYFMSFFIQSNHSTLAI